MATLGRKYVLIREKRNQNLGDTRNDWKYRLKSKVRHDQGEIPNSGYWFMPQNMVNSKLYCSEHLLKLSSTQEEFKT